MQLTVFGAGAVGGHIAARLGAAGHSVNVIARGATLDAIRRDGLRLESGDQTIHCRPHATDDPASLGPQPLVIVTVKAIDPGALAAGLRALVAPETLVVFAQNGIPWWYDIGLSRERPTPPDLGFLDANRGLRQQLRLEQIAGGVIHSSNEVREPGVVHNASPPRNSLSVGHPDDRDRPTLLALRDALVNAGMASDPVNDIRTAIWRKLLINMTCSVLCLLTGRRATVVRDDAHIQTLFLKAADEGLAIARANGIDMSGIDPRAFTKSPPDHLPSIRQDYNRGRTLELTPLLLAPLAFAREAGIATPHLDSIAALAQHMAAHLPAPQ